MNYPFRNAGAPTGEGDAGDIFRPNLSGDGYAVLEPDL